MPLTSSYSRLAARPIAAAGLVALVCALVTLGSAATVATATTGLVWSGVNEVGLPAKAVSGENRMQLTDLSCPAAGDCSAIGTVEPKGQRVQAVVVDETNGVWSNAAFVELPEASKVIYSQLESIDCPSVGNCTAVGSDEVVSKTPQAIVVSESGGSWEAAQVIQQPATSASATLASVACTGPGSCVAVGESKNASTEKKEAVAATQTNGIWATAVTVPQPADATPNGGLDSISCPSAGECAATGWYQSENAHSFAAMAANDVGGTWTSEGIALPTDAEYVRLYVSCSTSGSCGASGFYYESFPVSQAITASYANGKWSPNAQLIGSGAGSEYPYLDAPSCPASGSCVAVGAVYASAEKLYEPLVATSSAGAWSGGGTVSLPSNALTEAEAQALKDERDGELYSVSCWAVGACEAVGEYDTATGEYAPMAATEAAGVWGQAEGIAPSSKGEGWLSGVSCTAGGICGGAGSHEDEAGEYRGMTASAASALLEVTSSALPAGQVGAAYSAQLAGAGGLGPYTWSVSSGSLPAGLNLNAATGAISGTPTGAGASFTVSVATSIPPTQTAQRTFSIAIAPAPAKGSATPTVTIVSSKLTATSNKLQVKIACHTSTCAGVVKLVAVTKVRIRRKGKRVTEKRSVLLASGDYTIAAGKTQTIAIRLTPKGRKLLAKLAKHHSLAVKLTVTLAGGATYSKTVKLSR